MSFKDIWFDEMVRRTAELEDQGMSPDAAYEQAGEDAFDLARDRIAAQVDQARSQAKDKM